ncbi:hypothetical protein OEZ86_006646 [Tetradesmus obliquus]|nr:hypothetical protein OEZ86_006646 [Tetradesmus obliquus]
MAVKKSKTGKGKPGKGTGKKPSPPVKEEAKDAAVLLNPAERVAAVRPMWEQRPHSERVELLTVDLDTLRQQAKAQADKQRATAAAEGGDLAEYAALDVPLEEVLAEGLRRLNNQDTWKVWQFDGQEFYDADAFRAHVTQHHIRPELLHLLPKDDPKGLERPAEAALRQRMTDLLQQVQLNSRQAQEEQQGAGGNSGSGGGGSGQTGRGRRAPKNNPEQASSLLRDANVEMISTMLEALEKEHEHLYQSLLRPITSFVCEMLPEDMRETSPAELHYEDLEKLPPDDVTRVAEWLTEKVDALSSRLKAEQREDEEEEEGDAMGDVDLFALTPDGAALTVNGKWLTHLEERLLGEDGHPRKARGDEDPHRMGLVLEWVFGSIVSTAEKSRDGAKRCLGLVPPTTQAAYDNLLRCLEDQAAWEGRAKEAKDLMNAMLTSRKEADQLAKQHGIRQQPPAGAAAAAAGDSEAGGAGAAEEGSGVIPDSVIMKMLAREALLTSAKLYALSFDHQMAQKSLASVKLQIRHGEPELERLKRELEELKHAPRGLEGTFRSAAEMERHRHQLADAAIEEQLEVQTAFREQGAKLQSLYDKKQRTEFEIAKRDTEIKQLNGWKATVENLSERFDDLAKQQQLLLDIEAGQAALAGSSTSSRLAAAGATPQGPAAEAAAAAADAAAAAIAAEEGTAGPLAAGSVVPRSSVLTPQHHVQLNKLRQHFHKDVRKQLYSDVDDRAFFDRIKTALKAIEGRLEEGRVALQHLELMLTNVACDDPGAAIGSQLVLPLLQERLDAAALAFKAERAKMAEEEIIAMEAAAAEAKAAEELRRKQALLKKKGRTKSDKERAAAGKAAQEAAEVERRQREAAARALAEEEERKRRQEALIVLRQQEEELMAQRRQQLMAEDGYWAQRMAEEQQRAALAMAIGAGGGCS